MECILNYFEDVSPNSILKNIFDVETILDIHKVFFYHLGRLGMFKLIDCRNYPYPNPIIKK